MRLEPLANRVILEEIEEGQQTRGLWVPDVARKNKSVAYGKVIAVGPGRNTAEGGLIPCHVKAGDVVLFPRQAPAVLPIIGDDGKERDVLLLAENDVIAVVHDLPQQTALIDLTGVPLSIMPQSLARADSSYKNIDEIDRAVSDLRSSNAPPDVIEEIEAQHRDEV